MKGEFYTVDESPVHEVDEDILNWYCMSQVECKPDGPILGVDARVSQHCFGLWASVSWVLSHTRTIQKLFSIFINQITSFTTHRKEWIVAMCQSLWHTGRFLPKRKNGMFFKFLSSCDSKYRSTDTVYCNKSCYENSRQRGRIHLHRFVLWCSASIRGTFFAKLCKFISMNHHVW